MTLNINSSNQRANSQGPHLTPTPAIPTDSIPSFISRKTLDDLRARKHRRLFAGDRSASIVRSLRRARIGRTVIERLEVK